MEFKAPTIPSDSLDRLLLDIPACTDGSNVSALVDTGADFSILSRRLAALLKKVMTSWVITPIRMAGGHVITPIAQRTARIKIRASTFVVSSVVLREFSRDLILGADYLQEYGAVIDLWQRTVTFSTQNGVASPTDGQRAYAMRV